MPPVTSGTTTFNLRVDQVIDQAYKRLGGEHVTGENASSARYELNLLLIDLANRGIPLAKVEKKSKALTANVNSYTLDQEDVDILDCVVRRDDLDYAMERYSLAEYNRIPNKTITADKPSQYMVDRQRTAPVAYVWPTPSDNASTLEYYVATRIEDVTAAYQFIDISYRYLPTLVAGMAYRLSFDRGSGEDYLNYRQQLEADFEKALNNAFLEDRERSEFMVTPWPYMWG